MYRGTLGVFPTAMVEDLRRGQHDRTDAELCDVFQVCLPYRGLGMWHVERDDVVIDANQVIFVRAGEAARSSGPAAGGYAELILTPDVSVLGELLGEREERLFQHPLFRGRAMLAPPRVQILRMQFLASSEDVASAEPLAAEEAVVALLRRILRELGCAKDTRTVRTQATARLIRRTKLHLAERLGEPLLLSDIGRAVGVSATHLTTVFTRHEGLSLHQYITRLRLAGTVAELANTDDLSGLGLRAGFASHSHFTAAFRRAYGCTPSVFRDTLRTAGRRRTG